jgi:hypothetical protein
MNIQNLKQRLSPRNIGESIMRVVMRFPVAVLFLTTLTAMLSSLLLTENEPGRVVLCVLCFLCAGTLISLATSLWGEEQSDKRRRWVAEGVSLVLCGVYCVLLFLTDIIPDRGLPAFYIGNIAWIVAIVILIPFGSFLKEKDDLKAWHFILSLCVALLISGVVSGVMNGGLEGLLFGTAALFEFELNEKAAAIIMLVCSVLLFGMLFLALIPRGERKHNASAEMPSFLTKVVSWLLLPLLGCYIAVLYVYGINILIHWELPKGMLSWLVSAVMITYVLCYILLYPQVLNKQSWQSKVLTFWLPIVILPLLVLMTVGVVRRFMDYGITAPRLYLLTLLIWFYAICIVMLVVPQKRFRWIALSFAALFVLSSGQPLNYYRICRPILTAKIDKTMENKALTEKEMQKLRDDIAYMRTNYGEEYVNRWVANDSTSGDLAAHEKSWKMEYYNINRLYISPQGFATFKMVDNNIRTVKVSVDSTYNGILHVDYQDAVLLFDIAAIRQAMQQKKPLLVSSLDGKVAFTPTNITITAYKDHKVEVQYSGYIFSKEE